MMNASELPDDKLRAFLTVLSAMDARVLWKWESDEMIGKPDNVMLSKWLSQQDILGHPKVKLFITHGGLGSLIEAVYHGTPTLVMPCFGDQFSNAARSEGIGLGVSLSWADFDEDTLRC